MSLSLDGKMVVIVGGATGMGQAIAGRSAEAGGHVVIASRNEASLQQAASAMGGRVRYRVVDITSEASVRNLFDDLGRIDHLVLPGSTVRTGPLRELPLADAELTLRSKFWGPYLCARYANLAPDGSILLFSGILSRRPGRHNVILAATNAAVEALGRALALELAPVRVNTLSPGLISGTRAYQGMPEEARQTMFDAVADRLPVGRVGTPQEIADAALLLLTNTYINGTVLDVDGGGLLT